MLLRLCFHEQFPWIDALTICVFALLQASGLASDLPLALGVLYVTGLNGICLLPVTFAFSVTCAVSLVLGIFPIFQWLSTVRYADRMSEFD